MSNNDSNSDAIDMYEVFHNIPLDYEKNWSRVSNLDTGIENINTYGLENLNIRRKAEILQYKNNDLKLTKNQKYVQFAKGIKTNRMPTIATQGQKLVDSNVNNYPIEGNSIQIWKHPNYRSANKCGLLFTNGSSKNICLDTNIPLTNYIRRTSYK